MRRGLSQCGGNVVLVRMLVLLMLVWVLMVGGGGAGVGRRADDVLAASVAGG